MDLEVMEQQLVVFDLKYCERCGGLWFRLEGDEEVYCPSCGPIMAELPVPRKRRKVQLSVADEPQMEACIEQLLGFCAEGGNA